MARAQSAETAKFAERRIMSTYSQHSSSTPIPYRVGPLDYQSAIMCNYRVKAARWISWSADNPSRWYLKCRNVRDGGCVWSARREKEELVLAIQEERLKVEEKRTEADAARKELEAAGKLSCDNAERIVVLKD
uniref:Uncharacterized protein n=1 Tax=Oryza meridionalis TaxID=40149 RepID=A0A0E0EJY6_9ORYZ